MRLACDPTAVCSFEIVNRRGVEDALSIPRPLDLALDEAEAIGSTDLLRDVPLIHPDLAASVYTLILQLTVDQDPPAIEDGCSCRWAATAETQGIAGVHYPLAFADRDQPQQVVTGSTELEMKLRCFELLAEQDGTALPLPGDQILETGTLVLASCPAPCDGQVRHQAWYKGVANAAGVTAAADSVIDYQVGSYQCWASRRSSP